MNGWCLPRAWLLAASLALLSLPFGAVPSSAGFADALTGGLKTAEAAAHVAESLDHARQAVEQSGQRDQMVEHATEAKKHAEAAKGSGLVDPHLEEGIKSLNAVITHGNQNNLVAASLAAKDAVTHLTQVKVK